MRILDRRLLAAALDLEIKKRFGGVLAKAARKSGLPESTLRRLAKGRGASVREGVYRRLTRLLERDREFWTRVLFGEVGRKRFALYHAWIRHTRRRIVAETGLDRAASDLLVPQEPHYRSQEREVLWALIAELVPGVRDEIEEMGREHSDERIALAIDRIVEPLLDPRRSGYVELHWSELSPRKFVEFVRCGWKRERMLLDRVDDLRRIGRSRRLIHDAMGRAPKKMQHP